MIKTNQLKKNSKMIIHQENRIIALKNLVVYYKEITETVREPFIILDNSLRVVTANRSFYVKFKTIKKIPREGASMRLVTTNGTLPNYEYYWNISFQNIEYSITLKLPMISRAWGLGRCF